MTDRAVIVEVVVVGEMVPVVMDAAQAMVCVEHADLPQLTARWSRVRPEDRPAVLDVLSVFIGEYSTSPHDRELARLTRERLLSLN